MEWTYAYPAAISAHDMNWWFPCVEANNDVYSVHGKTSPFYVWGMNGWGGQLSGLEISSGGLIVTQAARPEPGLFHNALYFSKAGEQLLVVDGQLVLSYSAPRPNGTQESGYFAFSVFESSVLLGAVSIYTLLVQDDYLCSCELQNSCEWAGGIILCEKVGLLCLLSIT